MSEDSSRDPLLTGRRTVLRALGAGAGLAAFGTSTAAGQTSSPWSIVALPDTQIYAEDRSEYPSEQTKWIADNRDAENIVYVSHLGDVVEHGGNEEEWEHMDEAMSTLDGTVPYSTVPGNHDWETMFDRSSSIANYKEYFGPSRHEERSYFGGSGPTNGDDNRDDLSTYQLFSAGGYDFLHLALEWETPGDVEDPSTPLGWAQEVLDQHPDRPTIVTSHSYLRDEPPGRPEEVQEVDGFGNPGQTVWEELIAPNSQVFMVLCAHWFHDDGEMRQVSTNDADEEVYELLSDFQGRSDGGYGLLRQIEFRPGEGEDAPDRIAVRTYSPSTDEALDDQDSRFGFDLDFDARFGATSSDATEVVFEEGSNGYDGTVDTALREAEPETAYGADETVSIDSDDPQGSGNASQGLLRFDGLVGDGEGQIPPGATVQEATLTLETAEEGDGAAIHRLLTGWSTDDTWTSMDGGISADGSDAVSDPVTETDLVSAGTTTVDVGPSVQTWVDGERNHGWAFLPLGDDGWDVRTAESGSPPALTVRYAAPDGGGGDDGGDVTAGDADGDGDVDGEDVDRIQRSVANEDVDIDTDAADADGDGDVDIGDAIRVRDMGGSNE